MAFVKIGSIFLLPIDLRICYRSFYLPGEKEGQPFSTQSLRFFFLKLGLDNRK